MIRFLGAIVLVLLQSSVDASARSHPWHVPRSSMRLQSDRAAYQLLLSNVSHIRGGGGNPEDLVSAAYDWTCNLGAPAALVAGAVVATLYENIRGGELEVKKDDTDYARMAKKMTTFLLFTAFGLEIVSIFVTTVTGTMLLSRAPPETTKAVTALEYLRENFEFEYLTSRLTFLEGLLNWLAAVALEHTIKRKGEGLAALRMNQFIACSLFTLIVFLISFYNGHMTFYANYPTMIMHWAKVTLKRYFLCWPPRPLAYVFIPMFLLSVYLGVLTLRNEESSADFTEE